jgi:hypothetical protein
MLREPDVPAPRIHVVLNWAAELTRRVPGALSP